MSLILRKPTRIGRAEREQRDDRVFVVATEDTYAPEQYFAALTLPRVKVVVLPTPTDTCLSAPAHVVERLRNAFVKSKARQEVQPNDEFWILIDFDHYFAGRHLASSRKALRIAKQQGFEVAVSNPCFELWLLLHHREPVARKSAAKAAEIKAELRAALGSYDKTSIPASRFSLAGVRDAIRRARALEAKPDNPTEPWPKSTGTRVYRLLERVLPLVRPWTAV